MIENNLAFWTIFLLFFLLIMVFGTSFLMIFVAKTPFISSKNSSIKKMIKAANLEPHQNIFDLGCGQAKLLIAALKEEKTLQAAGYEISPLVYLLAKLKTLFNPNTQIRFSDFHQHSIQNADTIFIYLMPDLMPKLSQKILTECRPGTKIISNTFSIPNLPLLKKIPKDSSSPAIFIYKIK